MKINVSVLIGCLLCVWMMAVLGVMYRAGEKQEGWRPSEVYSRVGNVSTSNVSVVSSGSSDNVAVAMRSGRAVGSSRRVVPAPAFSYAHAGVSVGQSPIANTAAPQGGLYLTSSAEVRTFGGGSNAVVSVNGGSAQMAPVSPIASVNGMNMSSSLSTASQLAAGAGLQMPTNMLSGLPSGDIAMAAYAGIGSGSAGRMGLRGRQNAAGDPVWLGWLFNHAGLYGTGSQDGEGNWSYGFSYDQLLNAYNDYINNFWDAMWGPAPEFEDWVTWFQNQAGDDPYGVGGSSFYWIAAPVGDAWALLVLAVAYVAFVMIRRRKLAE